MFEIHLMAAVIFLRFTCKHNSWYVLHSHLSDSIKSLYYS